MIVGNGLLANAFSPYSYNEGVVLFASGVSSSIETNVDEFDREHKLLSDTRLKYPEALFVYFSSTSVLDVELKSNAYFRHKLAIEKYITKNYPNFLIFRLPQVIGRSGNKNTLLNYLYIRLIENQIIQVWTKATRNVMDVDDIFKIANHIISNEIYKNTILNISAYPMPVLGILELLEEVVGIKARTQLIEAGNSVNIPNKLEHVYRELNLEFNNKYVKKIIEKYYKKK